MREAVVVTHRYHPTAKDQEDAILYNDCERCAEQAKNPLFLDPVKFRRLWNRTVAFELHDEGGYKTLAEQTAGRFLWQAMLLYQRYFGVPITKFDALLRWECR